MSFEEWKAEAKPHRATAEVCFDRELLAEWEQANEKLTQESKGMMQPPEELTNHVEKLRKAVEAKTRTLVFQSIGRTKWRRLLAEHPPTDEQRETLGGVDHNPETFPQAAIAASAVEPPISDEDAQWMADELPIAVFERIWAACLQANLIGGDEKKAVATVAARRTNNR